MFLYRISEHGGNLLCGFFLNTKLHIYLIFNHQGPRRHFEVGGANNPFRNIKPEFVVNKTSNDVKV